MHSDCTRQSLQPEQSPDLWAPVLPPTELAGRSDLSWDPHPRGFLWKSSPEGCPSPVSRGRGFSGGFSQLASSSRLCPAQGSWEGAEGGGCCWVRRSRTPGPDPALLRLWTRPVHTYTCSWAGFRFCGRMLPATAPFRANPPWSAAPLLLSGKDFIFLL